MRLKEEVEDVLNPYRTGYSLDLRQNQAEIHVVSDEDIPVEKIASEIRDRTAYWHGSGAKTGNQDYVIRLSERSRL